MDKKISFFIWLLLTVFFGAHLMAQDQEAIRNVLLKEAEAFRSKDVKTLDQLWAHDDWVIVFEQGHANYGWRDYRDTHLVPEMNEMNNIQYELTEIRPQIKGDLAWVTFKYRIAADLKDRHVEGEGLGTAVLEKRSDGWKIVHSHTSSPRKSSQTQQSH